MFYVDGDYLPELKCIKKNGEVKKEEVGLKYDDDKIKPHLVKPAALEALMEVLTMGAKKYSEDNWEKVPTVKYEDALIRHYLERGKGEIFDRESKLFHSAHMFANTMFLLMKDMEQYGKK